MMKYKTIIYIYNSTRGHVQYGAPRNTFCVLSIFSILRSCYQDFLKFENDKLLVRKYKNGKKTGFLPTCDNIIYSTPSAPKQTFPPLKFRGGHYEYWFFITEVKIICVLWRRRSYQNSLIKISMIFYWKFYKYIFLGHPSDHIGDIKQFFIEKCFQVGMKKRFDDNFYK